MELKWKLKGFTIHFTCRRGQNFRHMDGAREMGVLNILGDSAYDMCQVS
jgi:hypothetical protein